MKYKIAVIGLGYVGLPLSIAFNKNFDVVGYDVNKKRINELKRFFDSTKEVTKKNLKNAKRLVFTSNHKSLNDCNIFVITVPTPINKSNLPDLSNIIEATKLVGKKN